MLSTVLVGFVALTGLFFGVILGRIAPEEIKPGMRYLLLFRSLLLLVLVIAIVFHLSLLLNGVIIGLFFAGMITALLFPIRYLALGIAVVASASIFPSFLVLAASLVFLYGLPTGTLFLKNHRFLLLSAALYFASFALLFVATSLHPYFLSFAAGLLVSKR